MGPQTSSGLQLLGDTTESGTILREEGLISFLTAYNHIQPLPNAHKTPALKIWDIGYASTDRRLLLPG